MLRFLARRLFTMSFVLVIGAVLVFLSIRLLPGDPVLAKFGASMGATPEALDALRKEAGLDRPILVQLFSWIAGAISGDLGKSYFSQLPVNQLIAERIPVTLELTFLIVFLTCILSLISSLLSVRKPGSTIDKTLGHLTSLGLSIPSFLIGIILIVLFGLEWEILPSRGFVPLTENVLQNLKLMILPTLTGAFVATPYLAKYLRTSMLEIKVAPFVRTAEGKGQTNSKILFRHVLPNALVPTLTMLGLIVGYTLGGVLVIEYMFGLPGIGSLAIESASTRDYAILQGVSILIMGLFLTTSLLFDLVCGWIDPRIRVDQ
jgi:peptide/nickel transport system permease protein